MKCCFFFIVDGLSSLLSPPERFIQNVVNQLGRHSISMEALMGKDLDQLAEVITGALQEADKQQPAVGARPGEGAAASRWDMDGNMEPPADTQPNQDQDLKSDKGPDPNQKDTLTTKQQGGCVKTNNESNCVLFFILS